MGFRFKRFDYVGGVAPWSGGSSTSDQATRSQAVCKDFADFIISCNKGWSLDTARNATTSDFVSVPMWDSSRSVQSFSAPGLFFVNTNGCKLFLCVAGFTGLYGVALDRSYFLMDVPINSSSAFLYGGIVLSMIPSGSSSSFGSTFDNTFLPDDATLLYGTALRWGTSYASNARSYISANTSGTNYSYGLFVDSYCIGIGGSYNASVTPRISVGVFIGRVLGTLAHEESTNQAKYGVIKFCDSYGSSSTNAEFTNYAVTSDNNFGADFTSPVYISDSPGTLRARCDGVFFKADGTRIDGRNGGNVRYYPNTADAIAKNSILSNPVLSGANRWVPFEAGVASNDLSTDGIVTGDGFKGYLDTDLFRCAQCNLNQLYANGAFIGANATYNLLLGWDENNTDTL